MKKASVTIRDVATLAKVSTATVSRVLNDDPKVSAEARLKVRGAVESLSYRVNQVARSLKTRSTRTIGVIAPALDSVFFMLLAESLERELSKLGYGIFVCSSLESVDEEKKRVRLMLDRLVDALVIIPASESGGHLAPFMGKGTPLLFIDRLVRDMEADAVVADNRRGAFEATQALIDDGFDRVGFIGGSLDVSTARERHSGYLEAMDGAGLAVEPAFVRLGTLHIDSGYRAMKDMLASDDPPKAFFIVNADTHLGATNYLMTQGAAFRQAVTFAAFDEMPYAPLMRNCRYSVSQPVADMGKAAARLLVDRIEGTGPPHPEIVRMPTRLIRHDWRS